ncbi:MAG TPA: heavy metal-responsive transcriptional regulator [Acidimicrobiia bacterium]
MRIGQLATNTGVSTKTIRFYEAEGLLPVADRAANGYRVYGQQSVDRLKFIKDAQSAGLALNEISTILTLRDRGETTCHHTIALLEGHMSAVEHQIEELHRTRSHLGDMIENAKKLDPSRCDDPNRCQTIGEPDDQIRGLAGASF